MIEEIKAQIKVVVEARLSTAYLMEGKRALLAEWEKQNKELIDSIEAANAILDDAEAKLRELTLKAYAETGNKAPVPGVGIRVREKLEYDPLVAFDWAKAHKMALTLDKRAFEKIAKADKPDFVKMIEEPIATIATELEVVE
jgi:hypothetical protein